MLVVCLLFVSLFGLRDAYSVQDFQLVPFGAVDVCNVVFKKRDNILTGMLSLSSGPQGELLFLIYQLLIRFQG